MSILPSPSIYDALRSKIISMEYAPGSSLSELDLARDLETTRAKIREALRMLAQDKLVQIIPQRVTTIARLDLANIQDSLFIIESLLVAVIKDSLPLEPEKNNQVAKLQQAMLALTQAAELPSAEFLELTERFYWVLSGVKGYERLTKIIFREKVHLDRVLRLSLQKQADYREICTACTQVLESVQLNQLAASLTALSTLMRVFESCSHRARSNHAELFQ